MPRPPASRKTGQRRNIQADVIGRPADFMQSVQKRGNIFPQPLLLHWRGLCINVDKIIARQHRQEGIVERPDWALERARMAYFRHKIQPCHPPEFLLFSRHRRC